MQISLDIKNETISKKILDFLASFSKEDIQIKKIEAEEKESINSFSGMWKDREIDLEKLREEAWKK